MESFNQRLKDEIEYSGMLQKEVAAKANIKKRALDMYLGSQGSMPPADVAVRLAKVLNVSVEYLVLGHENKTSEETDEKENFHIKNINADLRKLPKELILEIEKTLHLIAQPYSQTS